MVCNTASTSVTTRTSHHPPLDLALVKVCNPRADLLHQNSLSLLDRLMDRVSDGQIIAVSAALNQNNRRLPGPLEWAAGPELGRDRGAAPGIELAVGGDETRRVGVEPPAGVSVDVLGRLAKLAGVGVVALLGEEQFALALVVFGGDEAAEYCWLILRGTTANSCQTWGSELHFGNLSGGLTSGSKKRGRCKSATPTSGKTNSWHPNRARLPWSRCACSSTGRCRHPPNRCSRSCRSLSPISISLSLSHLRNTCEADSQPGIYALVNHLAKLGSAALTPTPSAE